MVLRYRIERVRKPPSVFSPSDFQESRMLYITVNIQNYPKVPWFSHQVLHEIERHSCLSGSQRPWAFFSKDQMLFLIACILFVVQFFMHTMPIVVLISSVC